MSMLKPPTVMTDVPSVLARVKYWHINVSMSHWQVLGDMYNVATCMLSIYIHACSSQWEIRFTLAILLYSGTHGHILQRSIDEVHPT